MFVLPNMSDVATDGIMTTFHNHNNGWMDVQMDGRMDGWVNKEE